MWKIREEVNRGILGVVGELAHKLLAADSSAFPALGSSKVLVVASDYGGQHKGSKYDSYSFVVSGDRPLSRWNPLRSEFRQRVRFVDRRMAYKSLGDKQKLDRLPGFLEVCDQLEGVVLTMLIGKSLKSFFYTKGGFVSSDLGIGSYTKSSAVTVEKLLRVTHMMAYFAAALSSPGQDIQWITDQDDIVPNDSKMKEVLKLADAAVSGYAPHDLGIFAGCTTGEDNGDLFVEDLTAIADLAAGSLVNAMTECPLRLVEMPMGLAIPVPRTITNKSRLLLRWLANRTTKLRKYVFAVDQVPGKDIINTKLISMFFR